MPEGHTLHRLARDQQRLFGGTVVAASSPQGRFADGAAILDGESLRPGRGLRQAPAAALPRRAARCCTSTSACTASSPPAAARRRPPAAPCACGWRTAAPGPTCAAPSPASWSTPGEMEELFARLGPDPLRRRADPALACQRLARSRLPIAALLMDQKVLAGIGNVYRAELLYRHRLDPFRPGRSVAEALWADMWADLVTLMRAGVRSGRIVTIRDEDRPAARPPDPGRVGVRLPAHGRAVPGLRDRDPDRGAGRAQPVLVPLLPGVLIAAPPDQPVHAEVARQRPQPGDERQEHQAEGQHASSGPRPARRRCRRWRTA